MPRLLILFMLAGLFSACTSFYPTSTKMEVTDIPTRFSLYSEETPPLGKWWHDFQSQELNTIMDGALNSNFSIQETWARVAQAYLSAEIAGAAKKPTINYSSAGSYSAQKIKGMAATSDDNWSLGVNASYEIDLWGKVVAGQETALLKAEATENDLRAAYMIVTGEIAEDWIAITSLIQQQKLFRQQLDLQEKLLEIIKVRFPNGQASALDIYQQQQAIEQINGALVPLESKQQSLLRQLAFLTGKATFETLPTIPSQFPNLKKIPAIGLPADLLAERPDIRAAGLRLKAAQWEITAAQADRLPALKLTASHTYSSQDVTSIFDNWLLNLAANVTGPIFDGKRRTMEVEKTKMVVDERLAFYRKTVFTAVKEVEDALADEQQQADTLDLLDNQLELSAKTMREAQSRYLNGNADFLNVLKEELNTLQLQQASIIAQEKLTIARIHLHKALGGAWVDEIIQKKVPYATNN